MVAISLEPARKSRAWCGTKIQGGQFNSDVAERALLQPNQGCLKRGPAEVVGSDQELRASPRRHTESRARTLMKRYNLEPHLRDRSLLLPL
jgi:hypothetical protein